MGPCSLGVISSIWNSASLLSSLKALDMSVMSAQKGLLGSCWGGTRHKTETKRVYALGKAVLYTYPILPYID